MLAPGVRLGTFEVLAPLGSGGMGEVYRARDSRLGREVAIKVLPAERLADPKRRARFVQEARSASAINHPHIVTIYEIESADGIDLIVMEYVEGQSLESLISKTGMPLNEALRVAIPIADAVAAAHARGIVHRDLKPANVVVSSEGVVKVLDFGLAKLVGDDDTGEHGETLATASVSGALSRPGAITGTAAYMSPEQATGGKVDARSDVFSFGAMLYEMVTGRRAFTGRTVSETLTSVVTDQPRPPRELVAQLPEPLERVILRCLRKEADRRFQHMLDVKVELQELKEETDSRASPTARAAARGSGRRRQAWAAAAASILAAAAAATIWLRRMPVLPPPSVVQLSSERWAGAGSFSPDGTQIAYASAGEDGANWDIWLKIVGQEEARRLTTDPAAEDYPAWSPDGTQIAFLRYYGGTTRGFTAFATGAIHLVSPLGGPARKLSSFPARLQLSWSPDGRWLASSKAQSGSDPAGGIYIISVATGEARAVTFPKPQAFDMSPSFSPDGRELAYFACEGPYQLPTCDLYALALDSGFAPRGTARRVTRERIKEGGGLAWARDGRSIVYSGLWRVRADGGAPPERVEAAPGGGHPSATSGRDRLVFVRPVGDTDIYRLPLGGSPTPIVRSTFKELQPQYSPDGRRIAFTSERSGSGQEIWLADADGRNVTRLTRGPGRAQGWPGWSPDGRSIVFDSVAEDGNRDVWTIDVDGSGLRRITHDPANDVVPSWSRDGRFIYFTSNRTGRVEVWRVPAGGGMEEQVTRDGGSMPFESLDGRTLYYLKGGDGPLMGRPTAGGDERTILPCVRAFGYAVAPRGIVHHDCLTQETGGSLQRSFRYWDSTTGQDRQIATVTADVIANLSVSPDGQSIVYGGGMLTSDLMMIEHFR